MSRSAFARYAAGALCAAELLAACRGATPSDGALPGAQSPASFRVFPDASIIAMTNSIGAVPVRHPNRGRSWILPDAHKQWLLYVSDGSSGTIDIYNYRVKAGKLYGQITGLSFPYGQCVDPSGNVYVVDNDTAKIYEYAHGGTTANPQPRPTITASPSAVRSIQRAATSRSPTSAVRPATAPAGSTSSRAA